MRPAATPRWLGLLLAAVTAILVTLFGAGTASAAAATAAQTRVGAHTLVTQVVVGPDVGIGAGQRLGNDPSAYDSALATGVAAKYGRTPFGPASDDAWKVLNRVDSKGAPLPGYRGGKVWDNNGTQGAQMLPRNGAAYREWDLSPKVKGVGRDDRRLVTGSDGSAYYTTDHYLSFIQFR